MRDLTSRQREVLDFIQQSIDQSGYPPTLREIGKHFGIRSTNGVSDHLRALERKGYIRREDMKSRALRPVPEPTSARYEAGSQKGTESPARLRGGMTLRKATRTNNLHKLPSSILPMDNLVEIPIVGRVAAGQLSEAIEEPEDVVRVDRMLVRSDRDVFGLRIVGDSMIEAGIFDGDYVFVRKQLTAERGAIIIALVGDEATCKYFYPEKDYVRLQPANSEMAPILVPRTEWRSTLILGIVIGVYRPLG